MIGPLITLLFFGSVTAVQFTLWWWLRRQTGTDRAAWCTALSIRLISLIITFGIVMVTAALIADTPASDNGFVLLMLPISHPILLFLGGSWQPESWIPIPPHITTTLRTDLLPK